MLLHHAHPHKHVPVKDDYTFMDHLRVAAGVFGGIAVLVILTALLFWLSL